MKNRIVLIAIVLLATLACSFNIREQAGAMTLPLATPTATILPTDSPFVVDANEEPVQYRTATVVGNWNLREGNGIEYPIIGYVYNGTCVQIIYSYYGWAWILVGNQRGWINMGALK